MATAPDETEARFATVVAALGDGPGVTHTAAASKRFGSSALKVHDKIFAMISYDGRYVVKLPRARVDALVAQGAGERFDANRGRPMREWLEVHSESPDDWLDLAREALQFVGT
jgi:hypothetical protein